MTLKFHWFLPTSGDGRAIMGRGHSLPLGSSGSALGADSSGNGSHVTGAAAVSRPPDIAYLAQVARSAEQLGFEAVLTPTGTWCEDAWLVTAALMTSGLAILESDLDQLDAMLEPWAQRVAGALGARVLAGAGWPAVPAQAHAV